MQEQVKELRRRCESAEEHAKEVQDELKQHKDDVRETIQDLAEANQEKETTIKSQTEQIASLRESADHSVVRPSHASPPCEESVITFCHTGLIR